MKKLYYIHDPMCSWCYAFSKIIQRLEDIIKNDIEVIYVSAGLASHSDNEMPKHMQNYIINTWHTINSQLGIDFNFDFWSKNKAKRSTYLSCQACIVARKYDKEKQMIKAIQKAYYLNAKNPSNIDILCECASKVGIDKTKFQKELISKEIISIFKNDLLLKEKLNINSFPSLILFTNNNYYQISIDYKDENIILDQINNIIEK